MCDEEKEVAIEETQPVEEVPVAFEQPKITLSCEEIDTRYQAHLIKVRGGK